MFSVKYLTCCNMSLKCTMLGWLQWWPLGLRTVRATVENIKNRDSSNRSPWRITLEIANCIEEGGPPGTGRWGVLWQTIQTEQWVREAYIRPHMETDTCLPSVPEELWLHSSASGRWEPDGMMFSLFLDILRVRNLWAGSNASSHLVVLKCRKIRIRRS